MPSGCASRAKRVLPDARWKLTFRKRWMYFALNHSASISFIPRAKDIVAFHTSFINTIKRFGRLWEIGLIAEYKLRTRHFWQDVVVAPVMLKKGKLSLIPSFQKKLVSRYFLRNGKT